MPVIGEFEAEIRRRLAEAQAHGESFVDILSGDVHREMGGYPGEDHRMPSCCAAMRTLMGPRDEIISQPRKGNGATVRIRYALPR
jgi:5-methylcytosine-specific restriction protein A